MGRKEEVEDSSLTLLKIAERTTIADNVELKRKVPIVIPKLSKLNSVQKSDELDDSDGYKDFELIVNDELKTTKNQANQANLSIHDDSITCLSSSPGRLMIDSPSSRSPTPPPLSHIVPSNIKSSSKHNNKRKSAQPKQSMQSPERLIIDMTDSRSPSPLSNMLTCKIQSSVGEKRYIPQQQKQSTPIKNERRGSREEPVNCEQCGDRFDNPNLLTDHIL